MTTVDKLVIPIDASSEEVERELRRWLRQPHDAARTTTGGGKKTGVGKAAIIGGVAGVVGSALAQNEAMNSVLMLLVNVLAGAFLPLLQAMFPLFEALLPLAKSLFLALLPLLGLLAQGISSVLRFLGEDPDDPPAMAVLKAAGRGAVGGAFLGAIGGSIIPGAGTGAGFVVGGAIGGAISAVNEAIEQTSTTNKDPYRAYEPQPMNTPSMQDPYS